MGRSGLSRQELRDFTREVRDVICEERPSSGRPLESATIRERLEERGVEVPDYAMYDVFEDLKGGLIEFGLWWPNKPRGRTGRRGGPQARRRDDHERGH